MLKNPPAAGSRGNPTKHSNERQTLLSGFAVKSTLGCPPTPATPTPPDSIEVVRSRVDSEWTQRNGEMLAADCRRRIDNAMERVVNANVHAVPDCCRALQYAIEMAELVIERRLAPPVQCRRTERQLAHPLTLADFVEAARHTVRTMRPPAWFVPRQDLRDEILTRLDLMAGFVGQIAKEVRELKGGAS